ncbi:MAG: VanZ family protein [Eubacteriales bacterium]|nr:VanZ family protein [Eubacteriales bacterium]
MLKKQVIKRYVFLSLSIALAIVIFAFSNQSAQVSSKDSEGLIYFLLTLISGIFGWSNQEMLSIVDAIHTLVRKTAHFSIYALLGVFVLNYVLTYIKSIKRASWTTVLVCFLYACSDEIHQLFIPGRSGEIRDVVIDTLGAAVGVLFMMLTIEVINRYKRRKKW